MEPISTQQNDLKSQPTKQPQKRNEKKNSPDSVFVNDETRGNIPLINIKLQPLDCQYLTNNFTPTLSLVVQLQYQEYINNPDNKEKLSLVCYVEKYMKQSKNNSEFQLHANKSIDTFYSSIKKQNQ